MSINRLKYAFSLSVARPTGGVFVVTSGSLVQSNIVTLSSHVIDCLGRGYATYGLLSFLKKQRLSKRPWAVNRAEATRPPPIGTGVCWIMRD